MGWFDKLFGRRPDAEPAPPAGADGSDDFDDNDAGPGAGGPVSGPPEFVAAVELQRAYWTHDPDEQSRLEVAGVGSLGWRDLLRLHHLHCLARAAPGPARAASGPKCRVTAARLLAPESPYRPRPALVWQGHAAGSGDEREPDLQGDFLNPSLTHLGCLEIYRVDAANHPKALDFVGFGELAGVAFAPPSLVRAARLSTDDGRAEIVLAPLLYGLTWRLGNEYDRDGRMTRFVAHLGADGSEDNALMGALLGATGLGVGQQDFSVQGAGGSTLFGLGSVAEIAFPLDMRDPLFDAKARARGIDPDEVRRGLPS